MLVFILPFSRVEIFAIFGTFMMWNCVLLTSGDTSTGVTHRSQTSCRNDIISANIRRYPVSLLLSSTILQPFFPLMISKCTSSMGENPRKKRSQGWQCRPQPYLKLRCHLGWGRKGCQMWLSFADCQEEPEDQTFAEVPMSCKKALANILGDEWTWCVNSTASQSCQMYLLIYCMS